MWIKRIPDILLVTLIAISSGGQWRTPQAADVPAYNTAPPKKGESMPPILKVEQLTGENFKFGFQVQAYRLAAKIPDVLYQQPCYCFCDRSVGHKSLRSCYESEHGAHCSVCLKEVFYAYQMTKAGKTPAQIRLGIEKQEWERIDLEKVASIN